MNDGARTPRGDGWRGTGVELALLLLLFWVPYAWVRPTNFWGFDEWLHVSLLKDGAVGFPYANRPLMIVWSLPTLWFPGLGWWAFWLVQGVYLSLSGCLVFLTLRAIRPDSTRGLARGSRRRWAREAIRVFRRSPVPARPACPERRCCSTCAGVRTTRHRPTRAPGRRGPGCRRRPVRAPTASR